MSNRIKYTFGIFYSAIDERLNLYYGTGFTFTSTINGSYSHSWNSTMNSGLTISSGSVGTITATNLTLSNVQNNISVTRLLEMDEEIKDLKQEISNLQVAMKMQSMNGEK